MASMTPSITESGRSREYHVQQRLGGLQKNRIYARAGVLEYWIVNLVERQIEVYSDPTGPVSEPVYRIRKDYLPGSAVPLVLEGQPVGTIAVDAVLP